MSVHLPTFGMQMEKRSWVSSGSDYRFGFNGMELDNEVKGTGNSLDFGARIYDARLGLWLSTDPLERDYPYQSTYAGYNLNPIIFVDPTGEGGTYYGFVQTDESGNSKIVITDYIDNGDDAPNLMFVRDDNATSETEYRKYFSGEYYEQVMIPTSWYSEDELKGFSAEGEFRSIYDRDRAAWIYGESAAKYSSKNGVERWWDDIQDNEFLEAGISLIITRGSGLTKFGPNSGNPGVSKSKKERLKQNKERQEKQRQDQIDKQKNRDDYNKKNPHTTNKSPSNQNKHESGASKVKQDQGGEKGDSRRLRTK